MRLFFAGTKRQSVTEAKNRLKSVIKSDRINLSENKTLEKMKKEVSAVLLKYCNGSESPPRVSVACTQDAVYILSATIPMKEETA